MAQHHGTSVESFKSEFLDEADSAYGSSLFNFAYNDTAAVLNNRINDFAPAARTNFTSVSGLPQPELYIFWLYQYRESSLCSIHCPISTKSSLHSGSFVMPLRHWSIIAAANPDKCTVGVWPNVSNVFFIAALVLVLWPGASMPPGFVTVISTPGPCCLANSRMAFSARPYIISFIVSLLSYCG